MYHVQSTVRIGITREGKGLHNEENHLHQFCSSYQFLVSLAHWPCSPGSIHGTKATSSAFESSP